MKHLFLTYMGWRIHQGYGPTGYFAYRFGKWHGKHLHADTQKELKRKIKAEH